MVHQNTTVTMLQIILRQQTLTILRIIRMVENHQNHRIRATRRRLQVNRDLVTRTTQMHRIPIRLRNVVETIVLTEHHHRLIIPHILMVRVEIVTMNWLNVFYMLGIPTL